jgi:hypothetical protein
MMNEEALLEWIPSFNGTRLALADEAIQQSFERTNVMRTRLCKTQLRRFVRSLLPLVVAHCPSIFLPLISRGVDERQLRIFQLCKLLIGDVLFEDAGRRLPLPNPSFRLIETDASGFTPAHGALSFSALSFLHDVAPRSSLKHQSTQSIEATRQVGHKPVTELALRLGVQQHG